MSNKKDNLKKSLGITEYPWSSDDDENDNPHSTPDVHILRRQPSAPRPSVADIPGTSGLPPPESSTMPPAPTQEPNQLLQDMRKRLKMDNEFFWSLIRGPHRGASLSPSRNKVMCKIPLPYSSSRNTHVPTTEFRDSGGRNGRNRSPGRDIQHVIACKKISRSLGSLRGFKPIHTPLSTHAGLCGFSKNTSSSAQKTAANFKTSRTKRTLPGRMLSPIYETSASQGTIPPVNQSSSGLSQARHKHSSTSHMSVIDDLPVNATVHTPMNINQSDDELELQAAALRARIENENEGPVEVEAGEANDVLSGRMSLEEEIVEIEPQPEVRANEESAVRLENNNGQEQTEKTTNTNNETANEIPQPNPCGVKRKKEEETGPFCVKELNQNLLRLLECPVCLEWMEPPMSQCRRGHLVCSSCRTRLSSCPVCRTTFSSVRNRAMEEVADMVRYPCRHGCGREARLRRRGAHEASCAARRYHCPAPACAGARPPLPLRDLRAHFQAKHLSLLKMGPKHTFSVKVNSEQHDHWLIVAFQELFYLRVDVEIRSWSIIIYVAYIGPKCKSKQYTYEVTINGQHNSRKITYARTTHSDLENSSLNISRKDCFHLTLDQALNFLRYRNRQCETDKSLDFNIEISQCEGDFSRNDSDS